MPNRSDVERVERDLLARRPALCSAARSAPSTTSSGASPAAAASARPVATDAQRALLVRRALAGASLNGLGRSARFGGFADALLATLGELESGLLDPDELDGDLAALYAAYRAELDRLGLWDRDLLRRRAAERLAVRARRLARRAGLRLRLRGSDRRRVGAARGARRAARR